MRTAEESGRPGRSRRASRPTTIATARDARSLRARRPLSLGLQYAAMKAKSVVAALLFSLIVVAGALAQSAEYGQASAGILDMTAKQSMPFSGSLSLSSARGQGLGFGGTAGGTLVKDRVWFFASGERSNSVYNAVQPVRALNAKTTAQIGDRQDLAAMFSTYRSTSPLTVPSSFLSLHSTSVLSSTSFVTFDVSQSRR